MVVKLHQILFLRTNKNVFKHLTGRCLTQMIVSSPLENNKEKWSNSTGCLQMAQVLRDND